MKTKEKIIEDFESSLGISLENFERSICLSCMDEYASQFRQEWIPVEERLPETATDTWTTIKINGEILVKKNWFHKSANKWDLFEEYVTAWQPIIKLQPYNPTKS